jgi:hypothetical protein
MQRVVAAVAPNWVTRRNKHLAKVAVLESARARERERESILSEISVLSSVRFDDT